MGFGTCGRVTQDLNAKPIQSKDSKMIDPTPRYRAKGWLRIGYVNAPTTRDQLILSL